jgi:fructuronate reductase
MSRLSLATLGSLPAGVQPPIPPADVAVGIVHLGIGAFHRAHQAVYTQAAMAATGDLRWGICGVTQRSATVAEQLTPQDGLYSVLTRSADSVTAEVNAAVRRVLPGAARRAETVAELASPGVHVVTLTVTEKGYRHDPATGRLRRDDAEIAADLTAERAQAPVTVVGQLVRGLQRRMLSGAGGISVVSCDNLPGNGEVLRGLVAEFVDQLPRAEREDLQPWIATSARFPATMIDRIVPATTAADRDEAARLLGVSDEGVVVTEPFRQWVVEDSFAGPRPAWERAGATLTADVAPYEAMKLRLLNGTHSALAYLGALAGKEHIADVVDSAALGAYGRALMDVDASPTLPVPAGFDLDRYKNELFDRFANPALRHRTVQIAMDGSQKLPQRLLGVIRERRAAGAEPAHALLAVAAWMRYVSAGRSDTGLPLPLDDPLADRLRSAVDGAESPPAVVDALLAVPEVFGTDLREDATVRRLLIQSLRTLTDQGAIAAATDLLDRAPA